MKIILSSEGVRKTLFLFNLKHHSCDTFKTFCSYNKWQQSQFTTEVNIKHYKYNIVIYVGQKSEVQTFSTLIRIKGSFPLQN